MFLLFFIIIVLVFIGLYFYTKQKIKNSYFPDGITQEGLDKMKASVGDDNYNKFLLKTKDVFLANILANKEKGLPTDDLVEVLNLLNSELKNYE